MDLSCEKETGGTGFTPYRETRKTVLRRNCQCARYLELETINYMTRSISASKDTRGYRVRRPLLAPPLPPPPATTPSSAVSSNESRPPAVPRRIRVCLCSASGATAVSSNGSGNTNEA
ncbi:hypothetical protein V1477_011968 [Vespula maculifrons]|uniref:Uncharacterized protein n=1 Tax=Vespula maculifrons TaxID=7453 RepID=A0ABD2C0P6_VESMC